MVKGYKATTADMTCIGFQFELNTTFTHAGKIEPCASGFHFCKKLEDIFQYYNASDTRIFEVEATGLLLTDGEKCVTNNIKFIREIHFEELYEQHSHHWAVRRIAAHHQYKLDVLVNDPYWFVRKEVARQGYGLDILINDSDCDVRKQVARQGYGLDILINDPHWLVQETAIITLAELQG